MTKTQVLPVAPDICYRRAAFEVPLQHPVNVCINMLPLVLAVLCYFYPPYQPTCCLQVLDAPALADDFYLNLVDWSAQNLLAVGLDSCVYLWSAHTSKVGGSVGDRDSCERAGLRVCWQVPVCMSPHPYSALASCLSCAGAGCRSLRRV